VNDCRQWLPIRLPTDAPRMGATTAPAEMKWKQMDV